MSAELQAMRVMTDSVEHQIATSHRIALEPCGEHWQLESPAQQLRLCQLVTDTICLVPEDQRSEAQHAGLARATSWIRQLSSSTAAEASCDETGPADCVRSRHRALLAQRYPGADPLELDRMQLQLSRMPIHSSDDLDLIANQAMKGKLSAERDGTRLFIDAMLGES